jgi:hypothetical protein
VKRETRLYTLDLPSLYVVPNASGNNWFEGNAGNFTTTGFSNFGTGDLALSSLTSGTQNTAVGSGALQSLTTGTNNFAFGAAALTLTQIDPYNVAIGVNALSSLGYAGAGGGSNQSNTAVGYNSIGLPQTGNHNTALGDGTMATATGNVVNNTVVGASAGRNLGNSGTAVSANTLIGQGSGLNLTGGSSNNTWLGCFQGASGSYTQTICFSFGPYLAMDFLYTNQNYFVWSMNVIYGSNPTGLHIYNVQDSSTPPVNYERAILDWVTTTNVFRVGMQAHGTGTPRLIAIDGFQKAGAPAAGDLPSGSFALINDTSGGATWLCYNSAGTIRKVQLT